mmetsp:Transcript_16221/g.32643  ORF Transcript_16221/g.32643 Transcript_16221/m.32643 type:complete len:94 (+) Transcript_16221:45-326(+)
MPPKKKKEEAEDLGAMRAARFGRVKNDLAMGFVGKCHVPGGVGTFAQWIVAMHCLAAALYAYTYYVVCDIIGAAGKAVSRSLHHIVGCIMVLL